jgi:hypothetical protein
VSAKSPVISITLASEVSGARAAEAKTAPIATTAYRAGWPAPAPKMWCATSPKAMPEVTPMNSDGAKMPPEPPIPMVRLHAAILANASTIRNHSAYWPAVALYITG